MTDINDLVDRYVAQWNESDPERRRRAIRALWTEDALHVTPSREVRGHAAMEERVAGAYEKWVRDGGHVFRSAGNADGHHDAVRFNWHMVQAAGGPVVSIGFDLLLLDADGRIRCDYQFIDPSPT
jgi:hypothetical protein